MDAIGYYRGTDEGRALIQETADKHGIKLMLVLSDGECGYSGFRQLQNIVKLEACGLVLIDSYSSLGDDKYIRLENELFLKRNGVRVIYARKHASDCRREIVTAVRAFTGKAVEWETEYGLRMPEHFTFSDFRRTPPFGYRVEGGRAVIDEANAAVVNRIFDLYIAGLSIKDICRAIDGAVSTRNKKFGNMTVKTVLRNERYLGLQSKKGYHLPAIVTYEKWLLAKERLERDYPPEYDTEVFPLRLSADRPIVDARVIAPSFACDTSCYLADFDALFAQTEELIVSSATDDNADVLYNGFVMKEKAQAEAAFEPAAAEYNKLLHAFREDIGLVCSGDYSTELQERLENETDLKNVYSMRLRRIASEKDLFSVKRDEIGRFFERARNIGKLSCEERSFIIRAFVRSVRIKNGETYLILRSPVSGKLIKHHAKSIIG